MSKLERVVVTDHALVRFMERVLDVDTEAIRAQMTGHVRPAITAGAANYFDGTFSFIFNGKSVVTVYEGPPRPLNGRR